MTERTEPTRAERKSTAELIDALVHSAGHQGYCNCKSGDTSGESVAAMRRMIASRIALDARISELEAEIDARRGNMQTYMTAAREVVGEENESLRASLRAADELAEAVEDTDWIDTDNVRGKRDAYLLSRPFLDLTRERTVHRLQGRGPTQIYGHQRPEREMTDSKLPTPEEQQAEFERRWEEYSRALDLWRQGGEQGVQPLRPVAPHTPGKSW